MWPAADVQAAIVLSPGTRTMLSRLTNAAARFAGRHTPSATAPAKRTASTAAVRPPSPTVATATSGHAPHQVVTPAAHTSYRWLLLLGSSLLVAEVVRRNFDSAESASAVSRSSKIDSADAIYNPMPIGQHDEWVQDWDGLEGVPVSTDPRTGRPIHVTRHLIFIRHGQYVLPQSNDDETDPVLTELGRLQARLTGRRLQALGYPIEQIHCSTMARAKETAELIRDEAFPHLKLTESDLLREGVPCAHVPQHPTWKPSEQAMREEPKRIKAGFESVVKRWRADEAGKQIQSKEQWEQIQRAKSSASAKASNNAGSSKPAEQDPTTSGDASAPVGQLKSTSAGTISLDGGKAAGNRQLAPINMNRYELVVCHGQSRE
jgi:bisphosphoglycerate-dependent phosphoglycerate mutase